MKQKFINFYMTTAYNAANLSSCKKLQVGCVIVTEQENSMYIGYNGTFPGEDNCCEEEDGFTKPEVLHAEENAIAKIAMSTDSSRNASIFITHQPCVRCAKIIARSGFTHVYYSEEYRCNKGVDLLKQRNVNVTKI